jgi:antitoxin HicB
MNPDPARYSATVRWDDEDGVFVARCPEFEGVAAHGASPEAALRELEAALSLAIEAWQEKGWPLPDPRTERLPSGQFRLRLPRTLHGWLVERAESEGISLNQLAVALLSEARGARSR